MGARNKLNSGYVAGSLFVAGLLGWVTQSLEAFILSAIVLIALQIHAGDIRPTGRRQ
jgi:hypothetical protein